MTAMLAVLLRTSAVLVPGLLVWRAGAARSAALRHAILLAAIAGATVAVPLSFVAPEWTVEVPSLSPPPAAPAAKPPATAGPALAPAAIAEGRSPRPSTTAILWAAGFALALARLAAGAFRMRRVAAGAAPITDPRVIARARAIGDSYGIAGGVALLEVTAPALLATWGLRPARVLLPRHARQWTDARLDAVLSHELAHVARADWPVQIAVEACVAALWFNPLAWIAARLLRREAEQACDDAVLDRGVAAVEYADHLIAIARDCRAPAWTRVSALPMVHRSAFERRIAAMLDQRINRKRLSRRAAAAFAGAVAVLTLAAATIRAVQAPPAALTGTVYDTTGAVVPGATITLEDAQQHSVQSVTDAAGRFSFPGVGSGQYVLSAELPGFRKLRDEFTLKDAGDWDRAVMLQLGMLQETIKVSASRAAPPAGAPAAPVRIRVGGNVRVPRKTLDVHPVFPDSMRAAGRQGQVKLDAVIGTDGSVSSVRVLSGQVHPDFAIAAADAVRQWRFTPTLLNGQPVEVVMTVTVTFSLSD